MTILTKSQPKKQQEMIIIVTIPTTTTLILSLTLFPLHYPFIYTFHIFDKVTWLNQIFYSLLPGFLYFVLAVLCMSSSSIRLAHAWCILLFLLILVFQLVCNALPKMRLFQHKGPYMPQQQLFTHPESTLCLFTRSKLWYNFKYMLEKMVINLQAVLPFSYQNRSSYNKLLSHRNI